MNENELVQAALDCGAKKAFIIDGSSIVLSEEFRRICEGNACGKYGRCYMCPPDVGEIGPLMDMVRSYNHGLLYQSISGLEDSYDIEGMSAGAAAHAQLSQRIQERLAGVMPAGSLHLSCGGCRLCDVCAERTGEPCRHPDKALPSMESYGIDVYNAVKDTPLKYINGENTVTFFGIVLWGKA